MSERATTSLVIGLFVCGVRADLLVEHAFDLEDRALVSTSSGLESLITDTAGPVHTLSARGWGALLPLPECRDDLHQSAHVQPLLVLSDSGQSSLSLCLSTLMSLGLYTSIQGMKRLSFGLVPRWYHTGGPFQVGHSMAVSLDSVCQVEESSFVQPVHSMADIALERHLGGVVFLWRTSQFTPTVPTSRGPPGIC